eukprot:TRINITY_DN10453_c0_g2_i1.p1 TRINITY_DN10453_c0_g2~~TRINITY_DN10453_c0_g2_i1.p1  ORF type:complete len:184 (-),score=28.45 TRINITY_DN10453_c0_g2_i1:414-965(-)
MSAHKESLPQQKVHEMHAWKLPENTFDPFLSFCKLLNLVVVVAAASICGLNIFIGSKGTWAEILLRGYSTGFAVLCILSELELNVIFYLFRYLQPWPSRGIFYVYVAAINWQEALTHKELAQPDFVVRSSASLVLAVAAGIYVILGLCCLSMLKERRRKKAIKLQRIERELAALGAERKVTAD